MALSNRKGGARVSPPDPRDWKIASCMDIPAGGARIPTKFECWIPDEIKDQGSTQSCTAHAMSYILANIWHQTFGTDVSFSTGFLYGNRRVTEYDGCGEFMRDVAKKVHKYGDVYSKTWDNNLEVPEAIEEFEKSYTDLTPYVNYLVKGYVRLYTKEEAKEFMYRYKTPLFVSLNMHTISPLFPADSGNHALACFSYSPLGFTCVNSWGNDIPYVTDKKFEQFEEVWGIMPKALNVYPDVPAGHWAEDAIAEISARGEMQGFPDGNFHPDEPITRAQAAVILQRIHALEEQNEE